MITHPIDFESCYVIQRMSQRGDVATGAHLVFQRSGR